MFWIQQHSEVDVRDNIVRLRNGQKQLQEQFVALQLACEKIPSLYYEMLALNSMIPQKMQYKKHIRKTTQDRKERKHKEAQEKKS